MRKTISIFTLLFLAFLCLEAQTVSTISDYLICDDNNDGIASFDLSLKNDEVINGQTGMTVSYHLTIDDANAGINALPNIYNNITNPETIFARLEETATGNFAVGDFQLIVQDYPIDTSIAVTDYLLCDNSPANDGIEVFDLTTKNNEIAQGNTDIIITYYPSLTDAANGVNAITNPSNYQNTSNPQTLGVVVTGSNGECAVTTTLTLIVNPYFSIELTADIDILCLDQNGIPLGNLPILNTGSSTANTYVWQLDGVDLTQTTPSISVAEGGLYTVTVINPSGCSSMDSIEITESSPPAAWTVELLTESCDPIQNIQATATGIGDFEFCLDGGACNLSGFFFDVGYGQHTIEIRDRNGCGEVTETIDVVECAIGNENFLVEVFSETCLNEDNGSISITAQEEFFFYVVTLTDSLGNDVNLPNNEFSQEILLTGINAGNYTICIAVPQFDIEQCFEINVPQVQNLDGFSDTVDELYVLDLTGAIYYEVRIDGALTAVLNASSDQEVTRYEKSLSSGLHHVEVVTDKACQGSYEEVFTIGNEISIFPNPADEYITLLSPDENYTIQIHNSIGILIKEMQLNSKNTRIDLTDFSDGIYFISTSSANKTNTIKFIKK